MSGFEENEISKNANGGTELISRHLQSLLDENLTKDFQIFSSRVREIKEDKIRIVFFNDLPNDPEVKKFADPAYRAKFHHFVFISNWQLQAYQAVLGFPYDEKCSVIEVGFDPIIVDWEAKKSDTLKLVYTSTPQRGLFILVSVFKEIAKRYPNIHLDVFSSFKIYGWEDSDKQFQPIYDEIMEHPQMTYRGFVNNEILREHLAESHIFAYPCTWLETSCRAMEEAMSAGLLCVHPNYGALPETSGGLNLMYQGSSNPHEHLNIFGNNLIQAIEMLKEPNIEDYLKFVKSYADIRYNINKVKSQWENLLTKLLMKHPPGSRSDVIFDTSKLFS